MNTIKRKIRVIPRLDVKGTNLVKGVQFEGLRVLGLPYEFAMNYCQGGADEILFMDTVASLFGRNNLHDIVKLTAEHIFIPMTVGGGIRSLADVHSLLNVGADKVAINTALFSDPTLISKVADAYGSQCMVVSIEAVRTSKSRYECLTDNGREKTGVDVFEWVDQAVKLGAGEILLTSVDNDGTGRGYDINLVRQVSEQAPVPVIACGGAGNSQHIIDVVNKGKADAISSASILHYHLMRQLSYDEKSGEGNFEFRKRSTTISSQLRQRISTLSIRELKFEMINNGINTRIKDRIKS